MTSTVPIYLADTNLVTEPRIDPGFLATATDKRKKSVRYGKPSYRRDVLALTGVVIFALLFVMIARAWDINPGQGPTDLSMVAP
jgi:hypothetical protein